MSATIQQLFDAADPRIVKIWNERNTQLSSRLEYQKLGFADMSAPIRDPQFQNFTGLGLAQATGELEPYSREDIQQGYKVTISPDKFTKAINISEEMLRFDLWPEINDMTADTANSVNGRIDLDAAKIFYLGFGTTFFTGGDGSALFADSHTMKDGSTQDNDLDTVPLSYDNLKIAAQRMDMFTDDKGIRLLPARRLRLVVGRENMERAQEVLRSIGNPDSANRVNNVFNNGEGYMDMVVSNWIPQTTYGKYWFVMDTERAARMARAVWGWKPRFESDNIVNNGSKIYTASTMFKFGFQSWQWAKFYQLPTLAGMLLQKLREIGKSLIEAIPREGLNTLVEIMYEVPRTGKDMIRTIWRHIEVSRNVSLAL